jgi:hypothetical protein
MTGCDFLSDLEGRESKTLLAAVSKIPFPPGHNGASIDGNEAGTSFSVKLEYADSTEEEIAAFYRKYFSENRWKNVFADEDVGPGALHYEKEKSTINVTTVDMQSKIHLLVIYREFKYTREEFGALVGKSATPEARKLVDKIVETYGGLKSYVDTGHEETIYDGELLSELDFETRYVAGGDFLFHYTDEDGSRDVISKIDKIIQTFASYEPSPTRYEDISLAIWALYGVSMGTSGNIPELLFGLDKKTLFDLVDLSVIKESRLEDGTKCLCLRGTNFNGEEVTLWIGKEDYLVRKIEAVVHAFGQEEALSDCAPLRLRRIETGDALE